jgi:hypothetical protein
MTAVRKYNCLVIKMIAEELSMDKEMVREFENKFDHEDRERERERERVCMCLCARIVP